MDGADSSGARQEDPNPPGARAHLCKYSLCAGSRPAGMEDVHSSREWKLLSLIGLQAGEGGCCGLSAGAGRGARTCRGAQRGGRGRGRGGARDLGSYCPAARAQPRSDGHSGHTAAAHRVPGERRSDPGAAGGPEGAGCGGPALIREGSGAP